MQELEALWRQFQLEQILPATAWVRRGVRPANAPARRVAAAGRLCARLVETGPVQACLAFRDETDWAQILRHLQHAFALPAARSTYWATHCDIGVPLRGGLQSLVGAERVREMLTNVILPFALAYAEVFSDAVLSDWAVNLLRRAPAGGINRLSRSMRDDVFGLPPRYVPMTAARQQGLLHIYHEWCREKRCDACAVGQMLSEQ